MEWGKRCCLLPNRKPGVPQWVFLCCTCKNLPVINAQTYPMSLSDELWPPRDNAGGAATQGGEHLCFWYLPLEFGMDFPREKKIIISNQCAPRPTTGSLFNTKPKSLKL